ncbi:MAG TPA: hypothetical protein VMT89_14190 [Candidatus Acidoferrales bacterium]|nr:hypothetical protein [Candidatus Acidoferrales bacterium]
MTSTQTAHSPCDLITLFRPVGPAELELIRLSGWRAFPPRLPDQPIFYPVTNRAYAIEIARDWNVRASGAGFVTRFSVVASYLAGFPVRKVGGAAHIEYWIPADALAEFNANIVGLIDVIDEFRAAGSTPST